MRTRIHDFTKQRFGRLVARKPVKGSCWICDCDCGNQKLVKTSDLNRGDVRSCGCLRAEASGKRLKTHGLSNTAEYGVWNRMKQRCYDAGHHVFRHYGGRGIKVCERWQNSFADFLSDMGKRPSRLHSIDRIDNDGDYQPGNCRWATQKEQANNTRANRMFEWRGSRLSLSQICDAENMPYSNVFSRLQLGWSIEKAATHPVRKFK